MSPVNSSKWMLFKPLCECTTCRLSPVLFTDAGANQQEDRGCAGWWFDDCRVCILAVEGGIITTFWWCTSLESVPMRSLSGTRTTEGFNDNDNDKEY